MSHKFVIIDEIMAQLEAAQTGLIPSSVKQSIISGIQNVPSSMIQHAVGGASSTCYTTFPLSPLSDNCCLDKTYLNFEFDISFNVEATLKEVPANNGSNLAGSIPFFIGFRDTASMFSQIQFLIEGTTIWQTVYQREESVVAYNSLPETEIRGNNQYASLDKLRNHDYCPMKLLELTFTYNELDAATHKTINKDLTVHFKCTVDINRLTPLLSNIHYTTPHMGNLRLKVFMQEMEKALFFCPDYSVESTDIMITKTQSGELEDVSYILEPNATQYWQFYSFNKYFGNPIDDGDIPFFSYIQDKDRVLCSRVSTMKFSNPQNGDFFTFANSGVGEIVQTNFAIKDEEYKRLSDYFESLGSVIIPTNVWSTSVFNNSNLAIDNWDSSMVGNVSGYNIDSISVWTHPPGAPCCMTKQWLSGIQLLLEGRPINAIPYETYNDKFITDMTQAIIDTDCEEINHDYMRALSLGNQGSNGKYYTDGGQTIRSLSISENDGGGSRISKASPYIIYNPNTFVMNFSTNLPDAFHSGACILENTNKQSQLRFISTMVRNIANSHYPIITNISNTPIIAGFSCLCDACIVLTYDAVRGTCFSGQLSWAAPYA